jgi:hypothetical protein
MTVILVSHANRRTYKVSPRSFGKLLHLARFNGWMPERLSPEWPSKSWGTALILPHVGVYMPGTVSKSDAAALMRALVKANATGEVASDGSLQFASQVLMQMAREGSFEVRLETADAFHSPALAESSLP